MAALVVGLLENLKIWEFVIQSENGSCGLADYASIRIFGKYPRIVLDEVAQRHNLVVY